MRKNIKFFVIALLVLSAFPVRNIDQAEAAGPNVTVSLIHDIKNVESLTFTVTGSFKEIYSGKPLVAGKTYTLRLTNGLISLFEGKTLVTKRADISLRPAAVSVTHLTTLKGVTEELTRNYLGTMNFKIEDGKYIRPVNILPLEEYVQGVVPVEMNSGYHIHALRTQAIAARSYVVYNSYKVSDTTFHQRYAGYSRAYNDSIKAAIETTGKVLTYNGRIIEGLYSASNGGYSETNAGAWPEPNREKLPYYPAKADAYDKDYVKTNSINKTQFSIVGLNPNQTELWWNRQEKDKFLTASIKKAIIGDIKITDITALSYGSERTEGKRVNKVHVKFTYIKKEGQDVVTDESGAIRKITGEVSLTSSEIQSALNIASKYIISTKEDSNHFAITAAGSGHGVGMSQRGAQAMALKGKGFRDILAYYYPGAVITKDRDTLIPKTPLQVTGKVNYEGTKIRQSTSTKSTELGKTKLNQTVTILGKSGVWFKVKTNNIVGYMDEKHINVQQTISYKDGITPITSGHILFLGSPIVSKNNTLYVPLPGLASRYKMKLSSTTSNFTVVDGSRKVVASHLSTYATVNGKKILLTAKPEKHYNKIYVPLSFLKQTGLVPSYYEEKTEQVLWINR